MRFALALLALLALAGCEQGYQDERGYHRGPRPDNDNRHQRAVLIIGAVLIVNGLAWGWLMRPRNRGRK